jgi:AraC-like DNA-binding protein
MDLSGNYLYISDMAKSGGAEIMTAAVTECEPDWRWDSRGTPWRDLILWLVTAGRGTMNYAGRVYPVRAGDCYVFRMWNRCVGEHDTQAPLTVHWCHFRFRNAGGSPVSLSDADNAWLPSEYRRPRDPVFLTQVFDRAIQYSLEPGHKGEADLWMNATLQELARQDAEPAPSGLSLAHKVAVREVAAEIRREPGRAWTVLELASRMQYSPDHFARVFRAVLGMSPRRYIMEARVESAKNLIAMSSYSISRIADLLGYSDVYHFSKQFKEKTGIPPSQFRKRR